MTGARLTAVDGLGGKRPAAFLIEVGERRLLLDLGEGPTPGVRPDLGRLDRVDAILLSHAHGDHVGALDLAGRLGDPEVHATAETWAAIANAPIPAPRRRALPARGRTTIAGVAVETGRAGHAPGGVWLHLGLGDGFLYTGDVSVESLVFPFDPPPPAGVLVVDASYGDFDEPLEAQYAALCATLGGGAILPVPPAGRGPEMALRLARAGLPPPHLAPPIRAELAEIAAARSAFADAALAAEAAALLARLPAGFDPRGLAIVDGANAENGTAADLRRALEGRFPFVFTGHVPPGMPAAAMIAAGRARRHRLNVHPRADDVVALARRVGAHTVLPAFVDPGRARRLAAALAPARVLFAAADLPLDREGGR